MTLTGVVNTSANALKFLYFSFKIVEFARKTSGDPDLSGTLFRASLDKKLN